MKIRVLCAFLVVLFLLSMGGMAAPVQGQSSVTLLLHDVVVRTNPGAPNHDVVLYFSLLDSGGNPIKDATVGDFTLTEDGTQVQIGSLVRADDEPISVAILLDTSGSMAGEKMDTARQVAMTFISDLEGGDRVAVLTFDRTTVHQIDFTTDHNAARQVVELIQYTPGGGTCLYDALYETIQMTAEQPAGRRAVILLTDGRDEAGGRPCSYYTVEDVIRLASAENTRMPIYTIGLGTGADSAILNRLAGETSGRYQYARGATQLDAIFGRLTDELRSQYVLHYTSTALGGTHTLTLRVRRNSAQDQGSLEVEFPTLPYSMAFTSPTEAAEVSGTTTIAISISGQGAPIAKVQFLANGVSIGSDNEAPYEIEWDPSGLQEGEVFLEAVAQDAAGTELARSGLTVVYHLSGDSGSTVVYPLPGDSGSTSAEEESQGKSTLSSTVLILIVSASLVLLGGVIAAVVIANKRRQSEKQREQEWQRVVQGVDESRTIQGEDCTKDFVAPSENALAVLVVLQSDDAAMIHRRIEITKSTTTLGRKSDNEIAFIHDSPVSRHHAVIEERQGRLYLSEVLGLDEQGHPKRPAYGTFVNGTQVQEEVLLRDGDEIQLGKRVRLRFEAVKPPTSDVDQGTWIDMDKTMDFGKS